jgi:hypothetical protein
MSGAQVSWTGWAADPVGPKSAEFHRDLAKRNALRFRPGLPKTVSLTNSTETRSLRALRSSLWNRCDAPLRRSLPLSRLLPMTSSPGSSN